jgi:hypothetical protein
MSLPKLLLKPLPKLLLMPLQKLPLTKQPQKPRPLLLLHKQL